MGRRQKVPLVWAVLAPVPEKPWHTQDAWDLVAVYQSEAQARSACDDGERVEAAPYFADHTNGEARE